MASAPAACIPSRIILDATSGNTGIAYAMIGAARGYKVKLCLPGNASIERKRILKAYGAEMVFSDPGEGSDGAIRKCREIYEADPGPLLLSRSVQQSGQLESAFRNTGRKSSSRPTACSRTSWRPWAPAARSWASAAGCIAICRT
jgi:cysteine synthase